MLVLLISVDDACRSLADILSALMSVELLFEIVRRIFDGELVATGDLELVVASRANCHIRCRSDPLHDYHLSYCHAQSFPQRQTDYHPVE